MTGKIKWSNIVTATGQSKRTMWPLGHKLLDSATQNGKGFGNISSELRTFGHALAASLYGLQGEGAS